jgi:hypothetical protein
MNETRLKLEGLVAIFNKVRDERFTRPAAVVLGPKGWHIEFIAERSCDTRKHESNIYPNNELAILNFVERIEKLEKLRDEQKRMEVFRDWCTKNLSSNELIILGLKDRDEHLPTFADTIKKIPKDILPKGLGGMGYD